MERSAKRKAMIAGSALALSGALAGAVTLLTGGQDTSSRPASDVARAQHVDLADPAPSDSTSPAIPKMVNIRVKNDTSVTGILCVQNSTDPDPCVLKAEPGAQLELDNIVINPGDNTAEIRAKNSLTGGVRDFSLPVQPGHIQDHCFRFQETEAREGMHVLDVGETSCDGF